MAEKSSISRRSLVKSSVLGLITASIPTIGLLGRERILIPVNDINDATPHDRYPAIPLPISSEVVGSSHFNLERLKQLVDPRPELARATWDWGFGDWESAIDAASHVGNREIINYLIDKGAVPTIFTYAVFGEYAIIKSMINQHPGIQKKTGPHGISLLNHARTGLEMEGADIAKSQLLVQYLESLGDADGPIYQDLEETLKQKYLGDYKFGEGEMDGFTIKLNMRKMLSFGKLGKSGGALWPIGDHVFTYQGAPSVKIKFTVEGDQVTSLCINEPEYTLIAQKV